MQQRTADVDLVVREFHEALARSSDMAVAVAAIQVGCAGAAESARLERGCQGRVREFHEALARSSDMAVAVAAIQVGCAGAAESARLERGCQGRVREFHEALARSTAPCPS